MFECAGAHLDHRRPCDLHHSALTVSLDEDLFVIEMAPPWGNREPDRGVVCEVPSATGSRSVPVLPLPRQARAPGWLAGLAVAARGTLGPEPRVVRT
jgi:hypothetical protein